MGAEEGGEASAPRRANTLTVAPVSRNSRRSALADSAEASEDIGCDRVSLPGTCAHQPDQPCR